MKREIEAWANALSSGVYRDCRDVLPHGQWCYLKQKYQEHPKGEFYFVHNPLGVFAEVVGVLYNTCEFDTTRNGIAICRSDITSPCSVYFKNMDPAILDLVRKVCDGSESEFENGRLFVRSFKTLAKLALEALDKEKVSC